MIMGTDYGVGFPTEAGLAVGDRVLASPIDTHPDWCAGYTQVGGFLTIGASAVGHLHLRNKTPRDDAFAIRSAGQWLAVAVSDGVGSRALSRYGSTFSVHALCEELLRSLGQLPEGAMEMQTNTDDWREELSALTGPRLENSALTQLDMRGRHAGTLTWTRDMSADTPPPPRYASAEHTDHETSEARVIRAFEATHARLASFASDRGLSSHDLSCTLLGLLIDTKFRDMACGQVGDGLIAMLDGKRSPRPLLTPPPLEEAGATYVISQSDWQKWLATASVPGTELGDHFSIMLMTDGVAEDYLYPPPEGLFEQWCMDMDAQLRETKAPFASLRLLNWLAQYEHPGSFDDRTLVAVLASSWPRTDPENIDNLSDEELDS